MNYLPRRLAGIGALLLACCVALPAKESQLKEFQLSQLSKVRSIQKVRSMRASLIMGTSFGKRYGKKAIDYAFYVAIDSPTDLSKESIAKLTSEKFARSRVSEEDVMRMILMEAGEYFVLLDEKGDVICLLARHDEQRMSIGAVVESGTDVYQNDPNVASTYFDFQFP